MPHETRTRERFAAADIDPALYRIEGFAGVATPALAIYPDVVHANVTAILALLGGNAARWRPHVKTVKLASVIRLLIERGIFAFKCATPLELATTCAAGAADVLLAYPALGENARRVRQIAERFASVRISALVESEVHVAQWRGSSVGLFVDVNTGMNRTGVDAERPEEVVRVAAAIDAAELELRGVHYYDGHLGHLGGARRKAAAHRGYDRLMGLLAALESAGLAVREVVTAGTPTLPCSLSYEPFSKSSFLHRVSPGTVVYGDATSLVQLPREVGLRPAALVVSTVVSRPSADLFTVDAGHKTVSADAGVPTCAVLGRPGLVPLQPSEEHLPIQTPIGAPLSLGDVLHLVPRHVCPTVNNFDHALIVRRGRIVAVERVSARGRDVPVARPALRPDEARLEPPEPSTGDFHA